MKVYYIIPLNYWLTGYLKNFKIKLETRIKRQIKYHHIIGFRIITEVATRRVR